MKIILGLFCLCAILVFTNKSDAQTFTKLHKFLDNSGSGGTAQGFMEFNNKLYFAGKNDSTGLELWVTDGTPSGTYILKDIWPGAMGSDPSMRVVYNNKLYFTANDSAHGTELWATDGTPAGTQMVKNIDQNNDGGYIYMHQNTNNGPGFITVYNGAMYFFATDSIHGYELWKSDGTDAGTVMVKDIQKIDDGLGWGSSSNIDGFAPVVYNNKLYFPAYCDVEVNNPLGYNLWESDGTEAGTVQITTGTDINVFLDYSDQNYAMVAMGGKLFFAADQFSLLNKSGYDMYGEELYQYDGSVVSLVKDIYPGTNSSNPGYLYVNGNKLYFNATDSLHGTELWISDGTEGGTKLLKDINTGIDTLFGNSVNSGQPEDFIGNGNNVFFNADDSIANNALYMSDGTSGNTIPVVDFSVTMSNDYYNILYPIISGNLYFMGVDSSYNGQQFFKLDLSTNHYKKLAPPNANAWGPMYNVGDFGELNNEIYFATAFNDTEGIYLWKYNDKAITGIKTETKNASLTKLYPVPARNMIVLETDDIKLINSLVLILNTVGEEIGSFTIKGGVESIDISKFSSGVYFMKTNSGTVYKFIKE